MQTSADITPIKTANIRDYFPKQSRILKSHKRHQRRKRLSHPRNKFALQ